ncbi:uncharacterized protein LOC100823786 [Brachypodium distachyon]|nr:uncharacterized protein LOC100823786 [Brachypodium distachyon]|eukprot:XP_003572407.2 uncharacterized protein LOC100823786 [Brachypodium distachyon]
MARGHGFRRGAEAEKGKQRADSEERDRGGFVLREDEEEGEEEEARSESSSIGAASSESSSIGDDSSSEKEEDGEEEVESEARAPVEEVLGMGLGSLDSLEDALPSKRGLSNFYAGKSKSFTSLAEAAAKAAAKEIAKPENPFNKRRRVLAAWSRRRASCSSLATAYLPPLLSLDHTVVEGDEHEEEDEDEDEDEKAAAPPSSSSRFPPPRLGGLHSASQKGGAMGARSGMSPRGASSFRSPRSFSLSDLQNASYD